MFMRKKIYKLEGILIRFFYNYFIKFVEKELIKKIKLKLISRLVKIECVDDEDLIRREWFKYNQWLKDPILSECYAKVHWQLNGENYTRYTREYYKEIEKRVYMMRPDLMKKYYSHNN